MIVTKWTMRRFHVASLLVLICARMVQGLPVSLPPSPHPPQPGTASSSSQSEPPTSDDSASTAAPPTPGNEWTVGCWADTCTLHHISWPIHAIYIKTQMYFICVIALFMRGAMHSYCIIMQTVIAFLSLSFFS